MRGQFHFLICLETPLESTWQEPRSLCGPLLLPPARAIATLPCWTRAEFPGVTHGNPAPTARQQLPPARAGDAGLVARQLPWWTRACHRVMTGQRRWFLFPGGPQCSRGTLESPTEGSGQVAAQIRPLLVPCSAVALGLEAADPTHWPAKLRASFGRPGLVDELWGQS